MCTRVFLTKGTLFWNLHNRSKPSYASLDTSTHETHLRHYHINHSTPRRLADFTCNFIIMIALTTIPNYPCLLVQIFYFIIAFFPVTSLLKKVLSKVLSIIWLPVKWVWHCIQRWYCRRSKLMFLRIWTKLLAWLPRWIAQPNNWCDLSQEAYGSHDPSLCDMVSGWPRDICGSTSQMSIRNRSCLDAPVA